jgi:hypothetical protein
MRKYILFLSFVLLTLVLYQRQVYAQQFKCTTTFADIEPDSDLCYFVNQLDYQRISVGYSDYTFRPNVEVTRKTLAIFIQRAFQIEADLSQMQEEEKFLDIEEEDFFFPIVHKLRKNNIINGYSGNVFKPEEIVNNEQLAQFIHGAIKYKNLNLLTENGKVAFVDVDSSNPFFSSIDALYSVTAHFQEKDQIISQLDGYYYPKAPVTRGQIAKVLVNSLVYAGTELRTLFPDFRSYRDGVKHERMYSDNNFKVYNYENLNMTMIVTKNEFDFNYIPIGSVHFLELVDNANYTYALNGSFFGRHANSTEHAGYLNYWGLELTPVKYIDEEDKPQLTHIVRYDKSDGSLVFIPRNGFEPSVVKKTVLEFQTGPIVVDNNIIQTEHIFSSKNGRTQHLRTLMGYNHKTNEKIFIVVKTPMSLQQIANIVLNMEVLKEHNISIINLDGGSSTTFYSRRYPELNWKQDKSIPIVIGMR